MLDRSTVNASRSERSEIARDTASSSVKKELMFLLKTKHMIQKKRPIEDEVAINTLIENLTAPASPLPSSFATRTLHFVPRDSLVRQCRRNERAKAKRRKNHTMQRPEGQ